MNLVWLEEGSIDFPPPQQALDSPNGLLAAGGDLEPARLVRAYQLGIFPWYEDGQPILWWSPDPRMVLFPQELHISTSLRRFLRGTDLAVTFDTRFGEVITQCGSRRTRPGGTWITAELNQAYCRLHDLGIAHSVEVWKGAELVGGLYGVALGLVFFGESMFSAVPNASKLALVFLVRQLEAWGFRVIDCQVRTAHLASMGAREIPRRTFQQLLTENAACGQDRKSWIPELSLRKLQNEL